MAAVAPPVAEHVEVAVTKSVGPQMVPQPQQQQQQEPESPHNGQACDNNNSLLEQSWNDLNSTLLEQLKALNSSQTPHMKRKVINTSNDQQYCHDAEDHNGFKNSNTFTINEELETTSQVQETTVVRALATSVEECTIGSRIQPQEESDDVEAAADPTLPPTVVRCFVSRLPQPQPVKFSTPCTDIIEEGHDSGVDESTQAKENGAPSRSTSKGSKGSPRKRVSRSTDPSPMKGRSPASTASTERKLPMNKIQVGTTASPNLKSVRSKIGSLDNATHRAGGGKVKIESKKMDFSKQAASRISAKNETYTPGGGEKKIESQKLQWKVQSKIGSLDNKAHKPGGGDKKIESHKVEVKAKSKVGSKDNIKHKAGGGEVQIESKKLEFKDKAASKVGSLSNVKHKSGGGEKKIFDDKEYIRQMSSPAKTPSKQTSRATSRASSVEGRLSPGGVMSPQSPHQEEEDQVVQVSVTQGVTPSKE